MPLKFWRVGFRNIPLAPQMPLCHFQLSSKEMERIINENLFEKKMNHIYFLKHLKHWK